MIESLINLAQEILEKCNIKINTGESPNIDVICIIKREFEQQYEMLKNQNKVIVLNKYRDLWALRTIIDSANFIYDKDLFEKVYEFADLCKKIEYKNLLVLYDK